MRNLSTTGPYPADAPGFGVGITVEADTTVTGNVQVAAGGNLVITGGTLAGEVKVAADGYLDASDTAIGGPVVVAAGGYGVFLSGARTGTRKNSRRRQRRPRSASAGWPRGTAWSAAYT